MSSISTANVPRSAMSSMPSSLPNARCYSVLAGPRISFRKIDKVVEFINTKYEGLENGQSQRLAIHDVTPEKLRALDEVRAHHDLPAMRITYFESEQVLIVKLVGVAHETVAEHFHDIVNTSYKALGITRSQLRLTGAGRRELSTRGPNNLSKEPDKSYLPGTRSGDDFPSWVMEIGVSEPLSQLRLDARLWLECTDGWTKLVLIIKLDIPNRVIKMERWKGTRRPVTRSQPQSWRAEKMPRDVTIDFSDVNNIQVVNAPLTLPITMMFDNPIPLPPNTNVNSIISVSENDLKDLGREMDAMI